MTTSDKDATNDNREDVIPYQRVTTVGITERRKKTKYCRPRRA